MGIWANVRSGDLGAINTALQISDRRAKLLGLDSPKVELSGPDGGRIPIELIDMCLAEETLLVHALGSLTI